MKTPGFLKVELFYLRILTITLRFCLSGLPIYNQVNSTSVENTFGPLENHQERKRKVKQESDWQKYYGSCPELKEDIKKYGKEIFSREILSLHGTKGTCNFEETKQLFLNNVLSEALDDGSPAYYNSNILGRYMRKDYGNFRINSEEDS